MVSSLGSSSEVSSQGSVLAKLVRVANQLKAMDVGKSLRDSPVGTDPQLVDAEPETEENKTNQVKNKLAQIFQKSKMRRLSGASQSDPVSPEQKHDGNSGSPGIPDYVLCL